MVTGIVAFFEIRKIGKVEAGENPILESDIWSELEATKKAKALGKKLKRDVAVYKMKQIFATDTGEFTIEF